MGTAAGAGGEPLVGAGAPVGAGVLGSRSPVGAGEEPALPRSTGGCRWGALGSKRLLHLQAVGTWVLIAVLSPQEAVDRARPAPSRAGWAARQG